MDVEIEVGGSETYTLPLASLSANQTLITGPAYYRGYSLRDTGAPAPVQASGQVVAPAAGATIAATGNLQAGTYQVGWTIGLQGAAAAADANNFVLTDSVGNVLVSVNPGAAGEFVQQNVEVTIAANTPISVKAVGAGTAAVTYSAELEVSSTGEIETIIELQDGTKQLAEISFRNERTRELNIGRPGILIETALNINVISGSVTGGIWVSFDKP